MIRRGPRQNRAQQAMALLLVPMPARRSLISPAFRERQFNHVFFFRHFNKYNLGCA